VGGVGAGGSESQRIESGCAPQDWNREVCRYATSALAQAAIGRWDFKSTVEAMSDGRFFSAFLRGAMAQVGQLDFTKIEVLGAVPEGPSVQHVVTRTHVSVGSMSTQAMEVISFKKAGSTWKIMMQAKMKGMADQIRNAMMGIQ